MPAKNSSKDICQIFCFNKDKLGPLVGGCEPGGQNSVALLFQSSPPDGDTSCNSDKFTQAIKEDNASGLIAAIKAFFGGLKTPGQYNALPCRVVKNGDKNTIESFDTVGECSTISTAIGDVNVKSPVGFITRLFSIVLSLAGLGAMILIIFSGYRLLISRGDKEKIQGARETITSAIVGLLFIIFALVILSVIGSSVLKIPGFG